MNNSYERYLDKLVTDGIEMKGYMVDLICGLKELSGKLDTLITIESAAARHRREAPKEIISEALLDQLRHG